MWWLTAALAAPTGSLVPLAPVGDDPGELEGFLYAPPAPAGPRPLIVALHGCLQDAAELHRDAGWSDLADAMGLAVVYPQQRLRNNPGLCFNWAEPGDHLRGRGESASVLQLIEAAHQTVELDESRVIVTGVSAGAMLAVALAANHPDVFTGLVVNAGGPYGCADNALDGIACMAGLDQRSPGAWADAVIDGNAWVEPPGVSWPRVVLWHGEDDDAVDPVNQHEAMEQWTALHDADRTPDDQRQLGATEALTYTDAAGAPVVWTYRTAGMGHGIQVHPGAGCGTASTPFFADVGLCTALESARVLGLDQPPREAQDTGDTGGLVAGDTGTTDTTATTGVTRPVASEQPHTIAGRGACSTGPGLGGAVWALLLLGLRRQQ
jgi:poly(hydroxyalkanoate) depolymerase family esterase